MNRIAMYVQGALIFLTILMPSFASAISNPDANRIFDEAEHQFPQYFSPKGAKTDIYQEWIYRYYSDTDIYAGINAKDEVYLLVDGNLIYQGTVPEIEKVLGINHGADENIYKIGDTGPAGGIVFYTTDGGLHGLEAAPEDQGVAQWGCEDTSTGATNTAIGTGASNTQAILIACPTAGIAARLADNYSLNGYNDWFLPSSDGLDFMYENLHLNGLGGFADDQYWSSTEDNFVPALAWTQHFKFFGRKMAFIKYVPFKVRAVRAF